MDKRLMQIRVLCCHMRGQSKPPVLYVCTCRLRTARPEQPCSVDGKQISPNSGGGAPERPLHAKQSANRQTNNKTGTVAVILMFEDDVGLPRDASDLSRRGFYRKGVFNKTYEAASKQEML